MTVDSSKNHKKELFKIYLLIHVILIIKPTACFFLHGHPFNAYQDSVVKQVFAKVKLDTVWYENYF